MEAIDNSDKTEELEKELFVLLNELIVRARVNCSSNVEEIGKRVSMLTPSSKRRKTHGTAHMH